jgi:hypothetical protein
MAAAPNWMLIALIVLVVVAVISVIVHFTSKD